MSLQTYRYSGPVSGVTLDVNGKELDVRLHPNKTVQLPESHEYTQTLLGLGYLTAIEAAPDALQHTSPDDATAPGKPRSKKGVLQ